MPFAPPPGLEEFLNSEPAPSVGREPASNGPPGLDDFISDISRQEKYGTTGQMVKTGLEGLARGATFGGSDILETKLLGVNPEDIKGRQETNPITSMGSQALGGVGTIALTGGIAAPVEGAALGAEAIEAGAAAFKAAEAAGLGAKAAAAAAREATQLAAGAGRAFAANAIGGAAEGAAFSAGNLVSEKALGNPNLTAEKILTDIGMGAALGGGFSLIGKGIETALPKATQKLTESIDNLKTKLSDGVGADTDFIASTNGEIRAPDGSWSKKFYQGMAQSDPAVAARDFVKNMQGVVDSAKEAAKDLYETAAPKNFAEALKDMPVETAKSVGQSTLKEIVSKVQDLDEAGNTISKLSPSNSKVVSQKLEELASKIEDAGSATQVHKALDTFAKDFDSTIKFDKLPTAGQMLEQETLRDVRNVIRGSLKDESLWGDAAQHYAQTSEAYSQQANAFKNFRSAFMKKTVGQSGSTKYVIDPAKAQAFFNRFNDVSQDLRKQYLDDFMMKTESLAKASESYHGYEASRESISSRIIEAAKKNKDLSEIANVLAQQKGAVDKSVFAGLGGDLVKATALHAMGIPNPVVGAGLLALDAYKAMKNPYALGKNVAMGFDKLHAISEMAEKTSEKIATAARSAVASSIKSGAIALPVFASAKGYDKRVERLEQLGGQDPSALMDHLAKHTEGISDFAPNTSQAIQSKMINAVQFLQSKIPRPAAQLPLSAKWEPSERQKQKFNYYCDLVDNPISILKEVKSSTVTQDSIDALQMVHPELLKEMRMEVMNHLDQKKSHKMDYGLKISLSKFLGMPLEQSLIPGVVASNQIPSAPQQLQGQPMQNSPQKPTQGGLKELSIASRTRPRNPENEPE